MKLKNKALLVIVITTFLSLTSILLIASGVSLSASALIIILSAFITFISIRTFIINRLEKLNESAIKIAQKDLTQINAADKILLTENDEITSIQASINSLLNFIQASQQEIEKQVEEKILAIQNDNTSSQQNSFLQKKSEANPSHFSLLKMEQNDEVTSLPNGIFFNEILNKAINHAERRKQILAILLIDIDSFKSINEKLGEDNSNLILRELGKRFSNVLRKEDILAKLNDDTFIVLLNDIKKSKFASMVAEKILNTSSQLLKIDEKEINLTASIGISIFPNDGQSLEELMDNTNNALFKVKQNGGNGYQFATEEMHVEALEYIQLESALRKALHNNELALYYQPMFRINTGNITCVETLMRWEHPVLGIVNPYKFIQLAEDSGLIIQIGEWALREAAQRIKYWQDAGYEHISVAIKLSPKQFHHPDIHNIITSTLKSVDINPKFIVFEITEKTIMEDVELAGNILKNIKATGVQISMDHFGTGYTSINYLKQFPISSIKVDKSYIKGIPNNPDDMAITSAMIGLAHNLGLEVIAEGVESAEQVHFLSKQSCDVVQGYFLSHPISAQKIVLQLKKLREEVLM